MATQEQAAASGAPASKTGHRGRNLLIIGVLIFAILITAAYWFIRFLAEVAD